MTTGTTGADAPMADVTFFMEALHRLGACEDAITWSTGRGSLEEAWSECGRGDWMLWFATEAGIDRRLVVYAACLCARESLPVWEACYPDDTRPLAAIETAEAWSRGEATVEAVQAILVAAGDATASASTIAASADWRNDDNATITHAATYAARAAAHAAAATATTNHVVANHIDPNHVVANYAATIVATYASYATKLVVDTTIEVLAGTAAIRDVAEAELRSLSRSADIVRSVISAAAMLYALEEQLAATTTD